jgi:FtsP/CotA-like multicopper oxidase with cupredoxin domain
VAIGVAAAGTVGAWAGGLVRPAAHPVAKPAVVHPRAAVAAAPVVVAGGQRKVAPHVAKPRPTAKPAVVGRHRSKPAAAHPSRTLTATPPPIALCAKAGTAPIGSGVPIWGFALLGGAPSCDDASVVATLPGPQLDVNAGDVITLNVTNTFLDRAISVEAPGTDLVTDVAAGATVSVTFTPTEGTYLYESGGDAGRQAAMGLYGALVVHGLTPGTVDGTPVDAERVLVLSEIDTSFNADPDNFDMRNWHPSLWLINGKAYPDTAPIAAAAGQRVLLRWLNAGIDNNTMSMLGVRQKLIAQDGSTLANPFEVVSHTFAAGSTADGLVVIPVGAGAKYALYNRNMNLGMTTFLQVP